MKTTILSAGSNRANLELLSQQGMPGVNEFDKDTRIAFTQLIGWID